MDTTTNYGLKIYEGSDKFNPLTTENYNFEEIDEVMREVADGTITLATHVRSGGVNAFSRADADCAMFRANITGAIDYNDTYSVDGVPVTCSLTDGTKPATGSAVIGNNVIGILEGTHLTLFVAGGSAATASDADKLGGQLPAYYAKQSDMTSAQSSITSINGRVSTLEAQPNLWVGTQAEYDALASHSSTTLYFIKHA